MEIIVIRGRSKLIGCTLNKDNGMMEYRNAGIMGVEE
jgi:hypothetical protein